MISAQFDFDWKRVGRRLIGDQCVRDIDREEHDEPNRRDRMLLTWLQQAGSKATCSRLVRVLDETGNRLTAERVTNLVMEGENWWSERWEDLRWSSCVLEGEEDGGRGEVGAK